MCNFHYLGYYCSPNLSIHQNSTQEPTWNFLVTLTLALVHSIPSWLVWAEIDCTMHAALPKLPMIQFEPVQLIRQQALKAYYPNNCVWDSGLAQLVKENYEGAT